MKRFYKEAVAGTAPGGHVVRLDGKILKTPLQKHLLLPSESLATALAAEWAQQGDEVIPDSMPLNQLVSTMIDKAESHERADMNKTVVEYGASDLVCYFATHPQDLVKAQEAVWLPLLKWLEQEHGVALERVSGIQYHYQQDGMLEKLSGIVAGLDAVSFTAVQVATGVTGSLVVSLALSSGHLSAEEAFQAACVDEVYQLDKWGDD